MSVQRRALWEHRGIYINNQDGCRQCVTGYVALISCRSIQLRPEAFWFEAVDNPPWKIANELVSKQYAFANLGIKVWLRELLTWETLLQEGRSMGWWSAASSGRLVKLGGLESSTATPEAQVLSPSLEWFFSNQDSHKFWSVGKTGQ